MKSIYRIACLGLLASTVGLHGAPIGAGSQQGRDFIIPDSSLSNWRIGVDATMRTRDVTSGNGFFKSAEELDETRIAGYIGYDILWSWVTVFAFGGAQETEFANAFDSSSDGFTGVGMNVNILSHLLQDPGTTLDRIRLVGSMEYSASSTTRFNSELDYNKFECSLMGSLINEVDGNSTFLPDAIAIFAGPVYSNVLGDDVTIVSGDRWGLVAGLELFLSPRASLNVRVESFAAMGAGGGFHYRF